MTSILTDAREQGQEELIESPERQPSNSNWPGMAVHKDPWLALAGLAVLGGVSRLAYSAGFVRPYLLEANYKTPLLDLAKINGHTAPAANAWAFTWLALFAAYYLAFRLSPSFSRVSRGFRWAALAIVCGWAAIFCFDLLQMYPVGAADLFDQIFRARLTTHYGFNPFTTLPGSLPDDPFLKYVAWRGDASPYGPIWELLAAIASIAGNNDLFSNLISFKLLVIIAYSISVALTYSILRLHKPEWALRGTLFFAWNPLLLFEVAGNGHNDAVVVMFLLLAVYLFVHLNRWAFIPALMLGALTKFVPILLVPVAVAALWRDRLRRKGTLTAGPSVLSNSEAFSNIALGVATAVVLAVVLYLPFWDGFESIGALGRQSLFTASLPRVAVDFFNYGLGVPRGVAEALVRYGALGLVVAVAGILSLSLLLGRNASTPDERHKLVSRTLRYFYEIIFVYLAFSTLWFQPWYLLWLIALTAPLARFDLANRTLLFCLGGVANYFVWDFVWLWNRTDARSIQITAAIAVYTLPLFYTLYTLARPLWERPSGIDDGAALAQPAAG
ncbi:MAG: glycosyltransferase family 39 protein [Chloroflexota bacterium]|nr:glycosyltransferase family 39 protein [Chloroflexota bacterium]